MERKSNHQSSATGRFSQRASSQKRSGEILEAARVLLSEEGYEQFSLRKVARRTGIHLKTLQHYFPSKEILIQSTLQYTDSLYTLTTEQISAQSGDARDHFESYIRYLIDDDKNQQTAGFFYQLWARAHVDPETNRTMMRMYRSHTQNIEALMEPMNLAMNEQLRKQRALMIVAMIEGMMLFVGYGKERPMGVGAIEDELVSTCVKLVLDS